MDGRRMLFVLAGLRSGAKGTGARRPCATDVRGHERGGAGARSRTPAPERSGANLFMWLFFFFFVVIFSFLDVFFLFIVGCAVHNWQTFGC